MSGWIPAQPMEVGDLVLTRRGLEAVAAITPLTPPERALEARHDEVLRRYWSEPARVLQATTHALRYDRRLAAEVAQAVAGEDAGWISTLVLRAIRNRLSDMALAEAEGHEE